MIKINKIICAHFNGIRRGYFYLSNGVLDFAAKFMSSKTNAKI